MKGVIINELIDMIETCYSAATADAVLTPPGLMSGGVYTRVGNYEYREFAELIARFAQTTQQTTHAALRQFGRHTFAKLMLQYRQFVAGNSAFEVLARIDDTTHATLRNVYTDARMPSLKFEAFDDERARIEYLSKHPLADFAEGLIEGCIGHFGERIDVIRQDLAGPPGTHACFTLTKSPRH